MSARAAHGAQLPWRVLGLAGAIFAAGMLVPAHRAEGRAAAGGARMATASVGAANRAAVAPGRPTQLPATPGGDRRPADRDAGWGWYAGYAYGSDDGRQPADDRDIDVEGVAAAAAAAAVAAAVAPPAPPAAGTVVYQLQPGCSTVERNGAYYRYCGGVYYQEQFEGDRLAYRVVDP